MDQPSDRSLLMRFRRGDQDAATRLYLRYAKRLRALAKAQCSAELARCVDADDIVQSVFRSFFRGASKGYYDVPIGEELWKLFLVIALNKIRAQGAFFRAAKRDVRLTAGSNALAGAVESEAQPDDAPYVVLQIVIDDILRPLPAPHQQMVQFRIQGHEVADIAKKTRCSKRTVERVLQQFRTQLRDSLTDEA